MIDHRRVKHYRTRYEALMDIAPEFVCPGCTSDQVHVDSHDNAMTGASRAGRVAFICETCGYRADAAFGATQTAGTP